ncbi:MAG: S24 family peptidase [Candidatus Alcyoniella australis]|nr:S24 family peptidase [Candidatus Alcyoniella australis]
MPKLGSYLRKKRKLARMTIEQVAQQCGITKQYVSEIELRGLIPKKEKLVAIAKSLGLDPSHLLRMAEFDRNPEVAELIYGDVVYNEQLPMIPVIAWAQAGQSGFWEDPYPVGQGIEFLSRPAEIKDPNAYALVVDGESMVPRLNPGDRIICTPEVQLDDIPSRSLVVVKLKDGEVMVKELRRVDDGLLLHSTNPEYNPVFVNNSQIEWIHRVVSVVFH